MSSEEAGLAGKSRAASAGSSPSTGKSAIPERVIVAPPSLADQTSVRFVQLALEERDHARERAPVLHEEQVAAFEELQVGVGDLPLERLQVFRGRDAIVLAAAEEDGRAVAINDYVPPRL